MKRALLGTSALLLTLAMPVSSVFASDVLDYANSIGSIEGSDTINYVVEATSDGGYIVGGQAMKCIRVDLSKIPRDETPVNKAGVSAPIWEEFPDAAEVVGMSECLENASGPKKESKTASMGVDSFCESFDMANLIGEATDEAKAEGDEDPDYKFYVSCIDYVAKFKKDGAKEWLTTINDSNRPVAVGESPNDYRMITKRSKLYTFAKTNGEEGISTTFSSYNYTGDAIIYDDGSFITDGDGVEKYNKNGQLDEFLEDEEGVVNYYFDGEMKHNDDVIVIYGEKNMGGVEGAQDWQSAVFVTDKNFSEITQITDYSSNRPYVITVTESGNVIVSENCTQDGCDINMYDGEGEKVKEIAQEDLEKFGDFEFIDNNIVVDYDTNKVYYVDDDLNIIAEHQFSEGEMPRDFATLDDGSIVTVGSGTASTDNYDIEGGQNGLQFRFILAKQGDTDKPDQPSNPSTFDGVRVFAMIGSVTLLGGAVMLKKFARR